MLQFSLETLENTSGDLLAVFDRLMDFPYPDGL